MHLRSNFRLLTLTGLVLLALSACQTINVKSNLGVPVSLTHENDVAFDIVGHFRTEVMVSFTIGGAVTLADVEIDKHLQREIERYRGDGVINLKLVNQVAAGDFLMGVDRFYG